MTNYFGVSHLQLCFSEFIYLNNSPVEKFSVPGYAYFCYIMSSNRVTLSSIATITIIHFRISKMFLPFVVTYFMLDCYRSSFAYFIFCRLLYG